MVAPRAGAWIETGTSPFAAGHGLVLVASRAGAWIETGRRATPIYAVGDVVVASRAGGVD